MSLIILERYKHLGQFAPLGGEQTAAQLPVLPGDGVSIGYSSQWLWYSVYARYILICLISLRHGWNVHDLDVSVWFLFTFQQTSKLAQQGNGHFRLGKAFHFREGFQSDLRGKTSY